jgi:hypothetical protein
LVRPRLRVDLFEKRIGERAGYHGEMIWILMMPERCLGRQPATAGQAPVPSLQAREIRAARARNSNV